MFAAQVQRPISFWLTWSWQAVQQICAVSPTFPYVCAPWPAAFLNSIFISCRCIHMIVLIERPFLFHQCPWFWGHGKGTHDNGLSSKECFSSPLRKRSSILHQLCPIFQLEKFTRYSATLDSSSWQKPTSTQHFARHAAPYCLRKQDLRASHPAASSWTPFTIPPHLSR